MTFYPTLLDYLVDQRPPERLLVPPGGDMGPANAFACDIAETARAIPSRLARVSFLRNEAAILMTLRLPAPAGGHEAAIMQRLADWADELRLVADNANGDRPCTAQ